MNCAECKAGLLDAARKHYDAAKAAHVAAAVDARVAYSQHGAGEACEIAERREANAFRAKAGALDTLQAAYLLD